MKDNEDFAGLEKAMAGVKERWKQTDFIPEEKRNIEWPYFPTNRKFE